MKHTTAQSSRHSCGKNLYQIADIVIDNCGEVGDCALSMDGLDAEVMSNIEYGQFFHCAMHQCGMCRIFDRTQCRSTCFFIFKL